MSSSLLFSMLLKMDAGQAKTELRSFVSEQQKASAAVEQSVNKIGRANQQAAGSVGNLVAQFNDVGMMMAAGQNPLQLAIQQGSQISQVIGPMGATGAVRALGGALLGMLNPVNLATFAIIAGGAALAQWAMSGEESKSAAESLADEVKELGDAMETLRNADKAASADFSGIVEQYGRYAEQAREILNIERQIAEVKATRAFNTASGSAAEVFGGGLTAFSSDEIERNFRKLAELRAEAAAIEQEMANSNNWFLSADQLNDLNNRASENIRSMRELANYVTAIEDLATQFGIAETAAADLAVQAAKVSEADNPEERLAAAKALADQIYAASDGMKHSSDEAVNLYEQLLNAVTAGLDLQALDIATGIGAGADEATRLSGNLADAANAWLKARSLANQPSNLALAKYGSRGTVSSRPIEDGDGEAIRFLSSSRNAGAGAARSQADSVAKLIDKLQAELDITRELDPVQQEMARYRDQLAKATGAESDKVRELIRLREEEKQKTEQLEYIQDQTGNALIDGLMGATDAGERLIDTLMRAALQALILGEGPLAKMFGGGTGLMGPLFSIIGGGAAGVGKADGGMIYGAGGPRDDAVPIWGSAGEFVVNARATQRHRALLEQINSGQLSSAPAFANGGAIGGNAGLGAAGGQVVLNINLDLRGVQGDDAVKSAAMKGVREALREYDRSTLPSSVRRLLNDPSVTRF